VENLPKTLKSKIIGRKDGKFINKKERHSSVIYLLRDRGKEGALEAFEYVLEELDEIRKRLSELEKRKAK